MTWVYSATQIQNAGLCLRKFGHQYIDGAEMVPKEHLEDGKKVHTYLKNWIKFKVPIPDDKWGKIARAGLHLLPILTSDESLEVEQSFGIVLGGYTYTGSCDVRLLDRNPPLVIDHKTAKNFDWIPKPEELVDNAQAALYACDTMFRAKSDECDLQWIYYKTKGSAKAERVHLRVTREQIEPTLHRILDKTRELELIMASGAKALDLPYDPTACEKFGGCEFQKLCNLTAQERGVAIMAQKNLEELLAKIEKKDPINPPETPAPEPVKPKKAAKPVVKEKNQDSLGEVLRRLVNLQEAQLKFTEAMCEYIKEIES